MRTRFSGRLPIHSPFLIGVLRVRRMGPGVLALCLAAACFPGTAAAMDTATPSQPYLAFNPAAVGIAPGTGQQLTASFSVTGSDTTTAALHYGYDYAAGAVNCTPSAGGQTCTVPVTFAPTLPGARKDALFLMDGTTVIAMVYLGGVGQSPLALVQPGIVTQLVSGATYEQGQSAVDENGTVYVISQNNLPGSNVYSVTKGGVVSVVPVNVFQPDGIAVDGAGILYISPQNLTNNNVLITWNTVTQTQGSVTVQPPVTAAPCTLQTYLEGVAVDSLGNLFTLDRACQTVIEIRSNGNYVVEPADMNGTPYFVAVDGADNVFFSCNDQINEMLATFAQSAITNPGDPENSGLAVDAADSLYVIPRAGGGIAQLPASNYQVSQAVLDSAAPLPNGLGLGSDGTLYVGNYNADLDKVDRSQGLIDFGEQFTVGAASGPQNVGLYNGGNEPLAIYNIALTGSNSGFAIQPAASNGCSVGLVIAPGALCQVAVTLTPPHVGTLTGSIAFATDSLNNLSSTETVALSGYMYGAWVTASPNPLAFGYQALNIPTSLPVTLTNTGYSYSASIGAPSVDSNAFTAGIGNCTASVAPGGTCQLGVTFDPALAQAYNGTVSLISTGNTVNQAVTFAVTGTGGVPIASLPPNPIVFPYQIVNSTSVPIAVALANSGTVALTGIVPSLTGTNPSDFAIATGPNACLTSLAAGSTCFIYVTFTPQAAINYSATLSVADNASGQPQTAKLTGTGLFNLAINEVIHITDAPVPTASILLNIAEVIHTADTPLPMASVALNIAEVIHTADAPVLTVESIALNIAEVIHTADAPVLTPVLTIATTGSGLAYSLVTQTYVGTVTLTNTGSSSVTGPFQILFTGLTANVTLANATGTLSGTSYLTVSAPASLAPGQSAVVNVQFKDPSNATIVFTPVIPASLN
jgi:hypothetical protein